MARTFPVFVVGLMGGLFASLLAGFLLASWTVAGIAPAYAAPPAFAREAPRPVMGDDGWREAGYERIGLWEEPRIDPDTDAVYADGSSRL